MEMERKKHADRGSDGHRGSMSIRIDMLVFPSMPKGEIVG
jgi:hypothetical protein